MTAPGISLTALLSAEAVTRCQGSEKFEINMKYMLLIYADEMHGPKNEQHCYAESVELTQQLHENVKY